ncbi:MAG: hypothetical protein CL959_01720 [Euryarchaeota archaeon]|nr:hypothetical protein [Euryarchaeota archaeon]
MIETTQGTEIRFRQPDPAYRKAEGRSQSELKEVLRSPAHWLARYGPGAEPTFPSTNMIIGTGLHCKVLEPEIFDSSFVDRSKQGKELTVAELKQQLEEDSIEIPKGAKKSDLEALLYPDGKPVDKRTSLSKEDFAAVCGMGAALRTHDIAGKWFDPGRANYRKANEVSLYVDPSEESFGLPLKGRLDRLERTSNGWMILDLKTTDDASASAFQRKSFQMGYHIQAAFYTDLVAKVFGCDPADVDFMFCAIERKRPHGIGLYKASDELISAGRQKYQKALGILSYCINEDKFPGYDAQVSDLTLPSWAKESCDFPLF